MATIDWKAEIVRNVYWKQMAAEHDPLKAFPWNLPRVRATPDDLAAAEHALGHVLPAQFRQFLEYADGWEGFHLTVDLFGTADFIRHRHQAVVQNPEVQAYVAANAWRPDDVTPIGATDVDLDVYLSIADDALVLPGGVAWFAAQEIERYPSFHDFFAAMVNLNARIANQLAQEAGLR